MSKYTTNWQLEQLHSSKICVDKRYQRPFNRAKVNVIVKNFDENLVAPPKVSKRDGKYWVFDGQHTIASLKTMNNGNDLIITCRVYEGLTFEDEVRLFVAQNGASTAVHANDKYRALFNAGDKTVTDMVRIAERHNIIIDFKKSKGNRRCIALSKLEHVFKNSTTAQYEELLDIINEAWDAQEDALNSNIIGGLSLFIRTYWGRYNRKILIKKLKQNGPIKIMQEASLSRTPKDRANARVILGMYNVNMCAGKGRLEDKI